MAKGNKIVVSVPPKGTFEECIISGTPLPGTIMEPVPGAATVGARMTYRASTQPTGNRRGICVLREDELQGVAPTVAYVAGTRGFLYWPAPGEELNCLAAIPGTGTGISGGAQVGERFIVGSNGILQPEVGSPAATPFFSIEAMPDISGQTSALVAVKYAGGQ